MCSVVKKKTNRQMKAAQTETKLNIKVEKLIGCHLLSGRCETLYIFIEFFFPPSDCDNASAIEKRQHFTLHLREARSANTESKNILKMSLGDKRTQPSGCFNHCSRHCLLSPGPLLPWCLKTEMIYVRPIGSTFCWEDGECSTVAPEALAGISLWPSTAVLIQPLGTLGSRRGGIGDLTLNMNKARTGQTGKVMRSLWKCDCVRAAVSEWKLDRRGTTGLKPEERVFSGRVCI